MLKSFCYCCYRTATGGTDYLLKDLAFVILVQTGIQIYHL